MKTIASDTSAQALTEDSKDKDPNKKDDFSPRQNFVLSKREAKAASPEALAVCGEEDPGEGLEFLVTDTTSKTT